ncbi:hypothetical protein FRB99_000007 [Tulasnella sp. 403]|nr:hypothetical protein FRB99_000007 [Tulasnella sp. 403]
MKLLSLVPVLAAFIPRIAAHYRLTALVVNGTTSAGYYYVWPYTFYNSPVTDVKSKNFTCEIGATLAPATATDVAGRTIGFQADSNLYHPSVINVYFAKAPKTAATYDGSGTSWFKVQTTLPTSLAHNRLVFGDRWPNPAQLPTAEPAQPSQPSNSPSPYPKKHVKYLVQIEHVALHVAHSYGGVAIDVSPLNEGNPHSSTRTGVVKGKAGAGTPSLSIVKQQPTKAKRVPHSGVG